KLFGGDRRETFPAVRDPAVVSVACRVLVEQQRTRPAGTHHLAGFGVQQMPVLLPEGLTAHVTVFESFRPPSCRGTYHPLKRGTHAVGSVVRLISASTGMNDSELSSSESRTCSTPES